ncbi:MULTISPECIES: hypothetical protein [Parachlamydia]|uniref:hypothetical protein n=1 Tax=Parachlamydia TaxID=83551 RepID=UPI000750907C|nr:hypothetical protein [Parachlamydia acanthamoebae]
MNSFSSLGADSILNSNCIDHFKKIASSVKVYGTGEEVVDWPQSRKIDRILYLHTPEGEKQSSLLDDLKPKSCVIDMGAGRGMFLLDLKNLQKDLSVIGVGVTKLDQRIINDNLTDNDSIYYGYVPEITELLRNHYQSVDLIMETYGPLTYAENPLHVLIFIGLLLNENGSYSCMSSTTSELPKHVFSTNETVAKIADFFEENMGIKLEFSQKEIDSEAYPGKRCTDFQFRMKPIKDNPIWKKLGENTPDTIWDRLKNEADQKFGEPQKEAAWYSAGGFSISAKKYL